MGDTGIDWTKVILGALGVLSTVSTLVSSVFAAIVKRSIAQQDAAIGLLHEGATELRKEAREDRAHFDEEIHRLRSRDHELANAVGTCATQLAALDIIDRIKKPEPS